MALRLSALGYKPLLGSSPLAFTIAVRAGSSNCCCLVIGFQNAPSRLTGVRAITDLVNPRDPSNSRRHIDVERHLIDRRKALEQIDKIQPRNINMSLKHDSGLLATIIEKSLLHASNITFAGPILTVCIESMYYMISI